MTRERTDKVQPAAIRGGGSVIAGIVIGGIVLVVSLFLFGERIFSEDGDKPPVVDLSPPEDDAPAR